MSEKVSSTHWLVLAILLTCCSDRPFVPPQVVVNETKDEPEAIAFGNITQKVSYGVDITSQLEDVYYWKIRLTDSGPAPTYKNWRLDLVEHSGTGPIPEQCQHSSQVENGLTTIFTACRIEPTRDLDIRTQIDFEDEFVYEVSVVADLIADTLVFAEIRFPLQDKKAIITDLLIVERPEEAGYPIVTIQTIGRETEAVTEDGISFLLSLEFSERLGL